MNREYYCKLGCDEELGDMLLELEELGEPIQQDAENYIVYENSDKWCWLGYDERNEWWQLLESEPNKGTLVDSEELAMKVKGEGIKRNVMKPFPVDKAYWKLRCIKETTVWYAGSPQHPIETYKKFYPGDITWTVDIEGCSWVGTKFGALLLEDNKNSINYSQGDFQLLEVVDPTKVKESPKFEKDKWYKSNVGSKGWYYIKVKTYSEYEVRGECIRPVKSNPYHEKDYWNSESSREQALEIGPLTDLSEIQKYLPDGHPDKIKEFVLPEKWCVKVTKENQETLDNWKQSVQPNSEKAIQHGSLYVSNNGWNCNLEANCTELTFEQFEKYVLKEKKAVLTLVKGGIYVDYSFSNGSIFMYDRGVDASYSIGQYRNIFSRGGGNFCTDTYRLPTPEEKKWLKVCIKADKFIEQSELHNFDDEGNLLKTKEDVKEEFKIGEWIATTNKSYISYGKIAQVKNIDGNRIYISLDGWWERKDVRKATPAEIASVTKSYKIGDWITIEDRQALENGCKGCPEGTWQVIRGPSTQGLLEQDKRFVISTNFENWRISSIGVRKARPDEIPIQKKYIYGVDPAHIPNDPKSLLDREEVEVTIKKTVPKQFSIF